MASVDACEGKDEVVALHLGAEENARINEIIKQTLNNGLYEVLGVLFNYTNRPLDLFQTYKWTLECYNGVTVYPDPLLIPWGSFAQTSPTGIMAAVVYAGKNVDGTECGWLLAWCNTKADGMRIYVDCGPKSKFDNITWSDYEENLKASGSEARFADPETKTVISAKFTAGIRFDANIN